MYGHLNLLHSLTAGAVSIQIPNFAAGHVLIMLCLILLILLNINPSTNVQNSETVAYFYTSLFMTLTGQYHSAFQF